MGARGGSQSDAIQSQFFDPTLQFHPSPEWMAGVGGSQGGAAHHVSLPPQRGQRGQAKESHCPAPAVLTTPGTWAHALLALGVHTQSICVVR